MKKYNHNINTEIAFTHIVSRKKQTFIAALGVTVGISIFIFMNSLMKGFDRYSVEALFKSVPHLRIYNEDKLSPPILKAVDSSHLPILINPKITNESKKILNPYSIIDALRHQEGVVAVTPEVNVNIFYNNGKSQVNGIASGIYVIEENEMFNLQSNMVDGDINSLATTQNGILLGIGVAEKLNVRIGDNIILTSALGVQKTMQIVGFFKTGIANTDKTKSYVNIATAQQLIKESPSYVTDIFVNVKNYDIAYKYVPLFEHLTGYKVEDWATASANAQAANKVRRTMALAISFSILLVAGFGIYNILNMTIMQKMNDIAILKAMGFSGRDVVRIFLMQAIFIGFIGVILGLCMGTLLVNLLSRVWIGGDIGFFPIRFEPQYFGLGILFGFVVTTLAGYIPSKKAAQVDPVTIFRK